MKNVDRLVENYVAVWNESNPEERQRRIRALWAPNGTTCFRLLDAHGYDEIEKRVTDSWNKFLRDGKLAFKAKSAVFHHNVVKFEFVMVTLPGGDVQANGLSFIVIDSQGRIQHDYQFNPSANDAEDLAERYVSILNESDLERRKRLVAELWAPGGSFVGHSSVRQGLNQIETEFTESYKRYVSIGSQFVSANLSQHHHGLARVKWQLRRSYNGQIIVAGSDLLIFDESGRVQSDYRFDESA